MKYVAMVLWAITATLALSVITAQSPHVLAAPVPPDPSPRFELLGVERLPATHSGEPAKVFVYRDGATHDEIICFAGEMRETMSCYKSGRLR